MDRTRIPEARASAHPLPFARLLAGGLALLAAACGTTGSKLVYLEELGGPGPALEASTRKPLGTAFWDGDHVQGEPFIVVDLTKQEALFYKGDTLVGMTPISSGQEGRGTPAGDYKILQKNEDHYSSSYGIVVDAAGRTVNADATPRSPVPPGGRYEPAPMPYFMRLTWDGVGMHEGFLPGYPASHGCIRMDGDIVKKFFANTELGTRVRVVR